jgi:hypothetical protein
MQCKIQNNDIFTQCDLGIVSPFVVIKSDIDTKNKDEIMPDYMSLGSAVKVLIHFSA